MTDRKEYMRTYMKDYNKSRGKSQRQIINTRDRYNRVSDRICSSIHSYVDLLDHDVLGKILVRETQEVSDAGAHMLTPDPLETVRGQVQENINKMMESLDKINTIVHEFRKLGILVK